jgi:hypothetical protein
MHHVRLIRDLRREGYTSSELSRLVRQGHLLHFRRGAYGKPEAAPLDAIATHRRLIAATVPTLTPGAVVSQASAAVLHGLPLYQARLDRVQLTRPEVPGGKCRPGINLHAAPLPAGDVVVVDGVLTTSRARTVADLARSQTFESAVVTGDAALACGLLSAELVECIRRMRRWPGVVQARRVAAFLDGRSESPGESRSRAAFRAMGIAPPIPQYEVFDAKHRLVARVDFCWEALRTIGEFDGRGKYGRLLKLGETPESAVYREKLREDALRGMEWQVVRWQWSELDTPEDIADRLRRAFARSGLAHKVNLDFEPERRSLSLK